GVPSRTRTYQSSDGMIYLTDLRFIYRCIEGNFNSISLPYRVIAHVNDDYEIIYKEDGNDFKIILSFNGTHKKIFLGEIRRLCKLIHSESWQLPYYSDIIQ
ncbi:hypothetical protein H311_03879, partial [Anncaliia algerae PRA109]